VKKGNSVTHISSKVKGLEAVNVWTSG